MIMELKVIGKGAKYTVVDKDDRLLYSIKKKGFGARYNLLDASNYNLYTLVQTGDAKRPSFTIILNDNVFMTMECTSMFLDPTIKVRHKTMHFEISSKDRKEFDIFASMNPAKEVGGDFYNFFMIDGDTLGIIIADVSDKGVPAALFMMSSDILLKNHMLMKKSPKAVLEEVNRLICESNREEMFVTVWLGILDIKTGRLTAANAGHEKPAIKSADGSFELYKDRHGMMVGYLDNIKYSEYELTLEKGSKLFLYTDGVVEANNAGNEQFGTVRMTEALRSAENGTPKEILKAVDDAIKGFVNDVPQFDDITMLCLEYKGTQVE